METVQLNRFAGASFFSSVTATVIQFSYQQTEGLQWKVVNLFWIMSLALSIGAAAAAFAGTVRRDARCVVCHSLIGLLSSRQSASYDAVTNPPCFLMGNEGITV